MIDKNNKIQCNGCKMCKDICPKEAIQYNCDNEGFWYPEVNYDKCVECGICVKKCPNINQIKQRTKSPLVYAAWSKDTEVRLASTSGGIFYELARNVLNNGGYVSGCVYDNDFKGAKHVLIDSLDDLAPLMVSKYLQSDTENIYSEVKEKLSLGKPILFVGAPCHCAAMVSYLGKEYDNLILCDFICRGANSPKAHKCYIEYLENKYGSKMVHLRSKDKRNGWNKFGQSAIFENGTEYYASREEDLRIVAYHHGNLMMREACNECKFKHIPRDGSDITLADFWSISPEEVEDIEKGVSLVMLNTDKGKEFFLSLGSRIGITEKSLEDALKGNPAIFKSAPKGKNRDKFLSELDNLAFDKLVYKYKDKKPSIIKRAVRKSKRLLKKVVGRG